MRFIEEFRNPTLARKLAARIKQRSQTPVRLMEFCGGHTAAIIKNGIRQLLSPEIELLSGPGCPVCVTVNEELDKAIALAKRPDVILTTFGDMVKVPGSRSSLEETRAEGGDVRVVYSAQDALEIARRNPEKRVVLVGIGFETTAPTVAASILEAQRQRIDNYAVLSLHKLCPPVMRAILDTGEVALEGIICPGHVSAVIGSHPYAFIPRDYRIGCAISGFEPLDILLAIDRLAEQCAEGTPRVEIAYARGVKPQGNPEAKRLMEQIFEVGDANWRGIGVIEGSGLKLRPRFEAFDAERVFDIATASVVEPKGCICGYILRGVKTPQDCSLFGGQCRPERPVGPCMVSSEGACSAHLLYGSLNGR
jgi:hydrogenase expression/formation protein HypD